MYILICSSSIQNADRRRTYFHCFVVGTSAKEAHNKQNNILNTPMCINTFNCLTILIAIFQANGSVDLPLLNRISGNFRFNCYLFSERIRFYV